MADTDGVHISLKKFNKMEITEDMKSVVLGAGVNWLSLIGLLTKNKLALEILP